MPVVARFFKPDLLGFNRSSAWLKCVLLVFARCCRAMPMDVRWKILCRDLEVSRTVLSALLGDLLKTDALRNRVKAKWKKDRFKACDSLVSPHLFSLVLG
jgi:hypothetical protein